MTTINFSKTSFNVLNFTDCQRYLRDPGSKLIRPAVHVLCAVARGSAAACTYTITMVMPLLLEEYALLAQVDPMCIIASVINFIHSTYPKIKIRRACYNYIQ